MFDCEKNGFIPEPVQQAIVVLRNELLKHGDLYEGFKASIESVLYEPRNGEGIDQISEKILRRIIGEE